MPDNRNIIKTVVEWLVDKTSLNKAKKGFDEIKRKNEEVNDLNKRNLQNMKDLGGQFDRLARSGVKAISEIGNEYKALQKLDTDLQKRLTDRDDQFQKLSNNVGLAGDVQSNLGAVQGLLGTAGASGAQQFVGGLGEVAVLAEELPRLKVALEGMPDVIRASASALGPWGIAFAATTAVITAGFLALQEESRKNADLFKDQASAFKQLNIELEQGTLTTKVAQERIRELEVQREAEKRNLEALNLTYEESIRQKGALAFAYQLTNHEEEAMVEAIKEAEKAVKAFDDDILGLEGTLNSARIAANDFSQSLLASASASADRERFIQQTTSSSLEQNIQLSKDLLAENNALAIEYNELRNSRVATDEVTARLRELESALLANDEKLRLLRETSIPYTRQLQAEADAKKQAEESSKEQEKSAREREQVLSRINRLAEQADSTIARFTERQADFARDQAQRLQDFNIKRQQDEQDHNRKLLDISRQGADRIAKLNQSVQDTEREYFDNRVKAQRDYADELRQLDEQRNLERIQRERANADDLNELEFENDVIGFLRAERRQAEERRKSNENAKLEDKQRAEQFNKQLADDQQAFIQRRALIQRQIAEEQRAIQQRVQAEREAFQLQTQRNQQAFDLERQRAIETLNLERQKTQQQLALIQQKAQLEANAVQGTISQIRLLQNAVNQLASSVSQFSGSTRTSSSSSNSNSYQARLAQIQAQNKARSSGDFQQVVRLGGVYASGGIVRGGRPSLNILGDTPRGIDEAVIPFKRSEGIRPALQRAGMNGSGATYLTINATVGENASVSEVKNLINEAVRQSEIKVVRGVASGISSSRFNPQT